MWTLKHFTFKNLDFFNLETSLINVFSSTPNLLSFFPAGKKDNKFGVDEKTFIKLVSRLKKSKFLKVKCLSVHIGSQITNHKP